MSAWKIIKLELGPTGDFPKGSPGRCYIFRLPLLPDGVIDAAECAAHPRQATVRRFWPNEADQSGVIARNGGGWVLLQTPGSLSGSESFHFEDRPLAVGACLTITGPSGACLSFRVTSVDPA